MASTFYSLSNQLSTAAKDGTKSDFEKRARSYSECLKATIAKDKATKGTNWVTDFTARMQSEQGRTSTVRSIVNPLLLQIAEAEKAKARATNASDIALISETIDMMTKDKTYIAKRMNQQTMLFANAASGMAQMELKTHNQIELPLQYLETIFCNSRQIMDYDTTEARQILKARMVKKIEMAGKVYEFPEAMNNETLMDDILGAGNKKKKIEILPTDGVNGVVDLFTKFGEDAVKGTDRFNPVCKVVAVYVQEGAETFKLTPDTKNDMSTQATWASRGQFNLVVQTAAKKNYNVSGHVNFSDGEMRYLSTAGVTKFEVELSLVGGTFKDSFSVGETREEKYIIVDQSVDAKYTWNPYDVTDKLTLENIDTLMSATSMIYETIINVKDYYAFKSIDDEFATIRDILALADYAGRTSNVMIKDDAASGIPTAGYHPTDRVAWRNAEIPEAFRRMGVEYRDKFHSRSGFKTVFYGRPSTTSLVGQLTVILAYGSEYGGVQTDYSVKSGVVNDELQVRLVSSERVKETNILKAIAKSDSENQEGFKFYQWMTLFCKNGELRDPENPAAACIVYTDSFKVENMFAVGGTLSLTGM